MKSTPIKPQRAESKTPYPNVPPIIESVDSEYYGSGVVSSVSIAGHPLHPLTVMFPIAFLSGAMGSDLGYWLTKDIFWARASVWLIGLGLVSGIIAAIVGSSDFFKISRVRKRAAGWAHMALNATALLLSAVNFWLRLGHIESNILPVGFILSLLVATLLAAGGWFGGELSYRHKVGVVGAEKQ